MTAEFRVVTSSKRDFTIAQHERSKNRLAAIVAQVRANNVTNKLTIGELAEEVKLICAQSNLEFDSELFSQIIGI